MESHTESKEKRPLIKEVEKTLEMFYLIEKMIEQEEKNGKK